MNMMGFASSQTILALALLLAAVVDDLRSRKVHNPLVIAAFAISILFLLATQGFEGLIPGVLSILTATLLILPLYLLRILGGGDVKIFIAVSPLLSWQEIAITLFASIVWGALLGVFQVILKGELKSFLHNLFSIFNRNKLPGHVVHKIPFTAALLFGFLSSLVWLREVA